MGFVMGLCAYSYSGSAHVIGSYITLERDRERDHPCTKQQNFLLLLAISPQASSDLFPSPPKLLTIGIRDTNSQEC
jgi:hypothetical protein